jgi:hypothetical protein
VTTPAPDGVVRVRFYVDDALLGEDVDGPPYSTEWVDENPYEPRVIRADVDDGAGGVVEGSGVRAVWWRPPRRRKGASLRSAAAPSAAP